jgi:hypothetical protein
MNKYIIIATTGDRVEMLTTMIRSINKYCTDWTLVLVMQGYKYTAAEYIKSIIKVNHRILEMPVRIGMHNAKMCALKYIHEENDEYIVCSADDDMEFTFLTDFTNPIQKLAEKEVGMISLGWVQHENALPKYNMTDEYIKQIIVYTGGGLLFNEKIGKILLDIPQEMYMCDNSLWSVIVYAKGYTNYRYRGTCTIHRICRNGGRRNWLEGSEKSLGPTDLLEFEVSERKGGRKYNRYKIPQDKNITQHARNEHVRNRENI